jgi:molybdopterin-guanine dinucleotide biosynthesis adapter protein
MKLVHIIGRQDHGKTTLVRGLIAEIARRGVRVGSIKHSSHAHELDAPGKDSHAHRAAGANPAAIMAANLTAIYVEPAPGEDMYARIAPIFSACDLVLVEGDPAGPGAKIEVWRAGQGTAPLALERGGVAAIVTDDLVDAGVAKKVLKRSDLPSIADFVLALAGLSGKTPRKRRLTP